MSIMCEDLLSDIGQVIVLSVCVCVVLCGVCDVHCELLKQNGQTNTGSLVLDPS